MYSHLKGLTSSGSQTLRYNNESNLHNTLFVYLSSYFPIVEESNYRKYEVYLNEHMWLRYSDHSLGFQNFIKFLGGPGGQNHLSL